MPDQLNLAPVDAVAMAQELIDAGRPFHAHEVLEVVWKSAPEADRDLWQGLAQLAVGLTHARRGNGRGAIALLRRGAAALRGYTDDRSDGIDVAGARARAIALASKIEQTGLASISESELRLRISS